jgi:hypothetical protein
VGCLQVKFQDIFLNLDEIWMLFQKSTSNFVPRYGYKLFFKRFKILGFCFKN